MANADRETGTGSKRGLVLVLVSGLPAVGKSSLVAELAPALEAVVLSRDQARLSAGAPARLVDAVTFRVLHRRLRRTQQRAGKVLRAEVERQLAAGRSVTVEAVAETSLRRQLQQLALRYGAEFLSVECVCADQREYRRRVAQRPQFWLRVVPRIAAQHPPPADCLVIDTTEAPQRAASRIVAQLRS